MKTLTKEQAKLILTTALSTGGIFAEIFLEDTKAESIEMTSGKVTRTNTSYVNGASLRIIKGELEVNTSLTNPNFEKLLLASQILASNFSDEPTTIVKPFVDQSHNRHVRINPKAKEHDVVELLSKASSAAMEFDSQITQALGSISKKVQNITVYASDGTFAEDIRSNIRLGLTVIASDGKTMQSISDSFGRNQGIDLFDDFDAIAFGREIASSALTMLHADEMVGGEMSVVIHNAFGGVILHEACGHSLEATSVARGLSVFCNKLNQKIASDIVNAVDDGTELNAWGSINVDDEGTPTRRNVLIENGILKSYLVDKRNAMKMKHPITGSSRRESYKYQTTSRMTNTFFLNGKDKFEDIIAKTKYGLFAKRMGGGSVNPPTGEFNFAVNEGYLIEDGKITKPVRGATLVGSGKDVLLRIDMIADNLSCGQGMCGSMSGSIPTNVGQPTIRVSHMTVGGKGGN